MPDCATWWFDHVGETYTYVVATKGGDAGLQEKAVEKLMEGAETWGDLLDIPEAGKLMGEHVAAVKYLVDYAFGKNQDAIDVAVEAVLVNAKQQADLYAQTIRDFPLGDFDKLFTVHITATGGYALALAAADVSDFKKNYNTVIQNRNQMARFWGLLCMRMRK